MSRLVLVVNADDYGLAAAVNEGIEQAHLDGVVTSTSVMANMPVAGAAAGLAERCPGLGVGSHLTLTCGAPSAPVDLVGTLVDGDGRLVAREALLGRLRTGELDAGQIVVECLAQLAALRELGIEPDHWDVHQHLQEYPGLAAPIAVAMRTAGVRRARNPTRAVAGARRLAPVGALRAARRAEGGRIATAGFATPDRLLDARAADWPARLAAIRGGVVEAICHPARDGPPIGGGRLTVADRAAELHALCDRALGSRLDAADIARATFPQALDGDRARFVRGRSAG